MNVSLRTLSLREKKFWNPNMKWMLVHNIRFTQKSIKSTFSNGTPIQCTIDMLLKKEIKPMEIPLIRIGFVDNEWRSIDNRRLYCFKTAGIVEIPCIVLKDITKEFDHKNTSKDNGKTVQIINEPKYDTKYKAFNVIYNPITKSVRCFTQKSKPNQSNSVRNIVNIKMQTIKKKKRNKKRNEKKKATKIKSVKDMKEKPRIRPKQRKVKNIDTLNNGEKLEKMVRKNVKKKNKINVSANVDEIKQKIKKRRNTKKKEKNNAELITKNKSVKDMKKKPRIKPKQQKLKNNMDQSRNVVDKLEKNIKKKRKQRKGKKYNKEKKGNQNNDNNYNKYPVLSHQIERNHQVSKNGVLYFWRKKVTSV